MTTMLTNDRRVPRRIGAALLGAAWGLLPAALALAAEEGAHMSPWAEMLYKTVNTLVLFGLLIYFLRKPVARFFRGAAAAQKDELEEVRKQERVASQALEDQRREIEELHAAVERMRQAARADAATELNLMTQEANTLAEKLLAQTRVQVEQELRKARMELRNQLADDTVRLAEDLIRRRLGPTQQQALVREYTAKLGARS